ncbi:MAG TPA: hypothetical protein VFJ74_10465 [Gemmatimonadaceae bacterium]|nr:hypothetical protein [Gemmatimonadaceae bacterium]
MRPASPCISLLPSRTDASHDLGVRRHASPASSSLVSSVAGVWDGVLYFDGGESGVAFSLLQNALAPTVASTSRAPSSSAAARDTVVGHVAFAASDDAVAAPVHILEASATTYVALVGPYHDAGFDAPVVMVLEGRRSGDRMWGNFRVRPSAPNEPAPDAGGRAIDGCFVAVKAMRAAA